MLKIKKSDTVQVVKGKDRGKKGKVIQILADQSRALVQGVNLVKKHMRKSQKDPQGGIASIEAPISLSNLMLLCKNCNRPARVGFKLLQDGTKSRFCKACKEIV